MGESFTQIQHRRPDGNTPWIMFHDCEDSAQDYLIVRGYQGDLVGVIAVVSNRLVAAESLPGFFVLKPDIGIPLQQSVPPSYASFSPHVSQVDPQGLTVVQTRAVPGLQINLTSYPGRRALILYRLLENGAMASYLEFVDTDADGNFDDLASFVGDCEPDSVLKLTDTFQWVGRGHLVLWQMANERGQPIVIRQAPLTSGAGEIGEIRATSPQSSFQMNTQTNTLNSSSFSESTTSTNTPRAIGVIH